MKKAKTIDKIATGVIYVMATVIVLILASLLLYILGRGLQYVNWHFLTSKAESFSAGGGIGIQLFNSFFLLILSMIISIPIALGTAIYLSEYSSNGRIASLIRTSIEILSSLPSIVVGLFGFLIFVINFHIGFSILSGALTLTVFNLPLLIRSIEDALRSIPNSQREAGLALGLSKYETVIRVIIPDALPAIITGLILGAGRVFGEAAALIYTAGQSAPPVDFTNFNPMSITSPLNLMRPAETLAVHIWKVNSEGLIPDAVAVSAGASAVLILAVLLFNLASRYLGNFIYTKMTGNK
ncbi:phosphate ABC transporter permease PstA [Lactobacillus sp. YT155]|uniref:phosphate ABC transporter permease PstA n=1 Tax=Lactobacillus sp. YT155 TaxID=3060955 RepID=UPI00265F45A5|nr:phosphate ABC transporter permease PstA [Lactobacillus sp. YT155]MDO1605121.1 phosphate ABC transporter permease PstA [Lactobacillus sp. YT155]